MELPHNHRQDACAGRTRKAARFFVTESPVPATLVERREAMKAHCVMLLCSPTGRQVSQSMPRDRWDEARDKAALTAEQAGNSDLGARIRSMYLRDMRSLAADLAGTSQEASELLQHSSKALTDRHYRTRAQTLKAVR